jgi:hypothetical protein
MDSIDIENNNVPAELRLMIVQSKGPPIFLLQALCQDRLSFSYYLWLKT